MKKLIANRMTATITSGTCGVFGMIARNTSAAPVVMIALGCAANWPITSVFRLPSETERVTIIPVAVEIMSAGSWETRPSPMVAVEYCAATVDRSPPPITMPIMMPPIRLIAVIMSDMTASPLTILVAPSIAP